MRKDHASIVLQIGKTTYMDSNVSSIQGKGVCEYLSSTVAS